jgi:hypothetical protein
MLCWRAFSANALPDEMQLHVCLSTCLLQPFSACLPPHVRACMRALVCACERWCVHGRPRMRFVVEKK